MKAADLAILIGNIDEKYIEEAATEKGSVRVFRTKRALIAAVVAALMLALSATAFAADWFGIRSLLLTETPAEDMQGENMQQVQQEPDTITLAGLAETDEYKAAAEWHEFLASYDVIGAAGSGNSIFAPGTSYNFYQVYNQEMADKLDQITEEYNLKLHTEMFTDIYTNEELCSLVGGDFLGTANEARSIYMYEDGTFRFDGIARLSGAELEYQFMRSVKGTFNDVTLNIGDNVQYEEKSYETDEGVHVTLALGPHRSLVIADFEDCLVTAIVLAGKEASPEAIFSDRPLDMKIMEEFAESFDFKVLSPAMAAEPFFSKK